MNFDKIPFFFNDIYKKPIFFILYYFHLTFTDNDDSFNAMKMMMMSQIDRLMLRRSSHNPCIASNH